MKTKEDNKDGNDQDFDLLNAAVCLLILVAFFAGLVWLLAKLGCDGKSRLPWEL